MLPEEPYVVNCRKGLNRLESKKRYKKGLDHAGIFPYLMMLPVIIFLCVFIFYPFLRTIYNTFFVTNISGNPTKFVGWKNWIRVFESAKYRNSLLVTFKFAGLIFLPSLVLGFILALIANQKSRFSRVYEVLFSLPMAVASAPAAAIWRSIFNPSIGILNRVLGTNIEWLETAPFAILAVAFITIWGRSAVNFLFLLAGLRAIPDDVIESSRIDGAGYFRRLFHIMIPLASPQIFFVIFMSIISSLSAFGQIKLLTGAGPNSSTDVLIYEIYSTAMVQTRFETACVLSLILFAITFLFTRIQFVVEKKVVTYL